MEMENQEYYFDVSYQRSKDGPVGMIYLPKPPADPVRLGEG